MSRQQVYWCAATVVLILLASAGSSILTARQEPVKPIPAPPAAAAQKKAQGPLEEHPHAKTKRAEVEAVLNKMIVEYDLKPHGLPAIPDDPPPHEGAMIDYPELIEPPDLLLVEVLEALPGRPISGERLVRSDGTIDLGFYGDVHVAGLTLKQAKVRIIQRLRHFLDDEVLGLIELRSDLKDEEPENGKAPGTSSRIPDPPGEKSPFRLEHNKRAAPESNKPRTASRGFRVHSVAQKDAARSLRNRASRSRFQLLGRSQEPEAKQGGEPKQSIKIPLEAGKNVVITVEVRSPEKEAALPDRNDREDVGEMQDDLIQGPIAPDDSDHVFVDITAYNSKNYYVLGDLGTPGRLPFTGRETVLDALNFAGGLLSTAEPKDIRLVRPARGGKPARTYTVDLEAIRDKGDATTNYQVFPGDRLIVGRNNVVQKTVELDRLAIPMQTITNAILQESSLLRSLQTTSPDNHQAILDRLIGFWAQQMTRPNGVELDEQNVRAALIQQLKPKPEKK